MDSMHNVGVAEPKLTWGSDFKTSINFALGWLTPTELYLQYILIYAASDLTAQEHMNIVKFM